MQSFELHSCVRLGSHLKKDFGGIHVFCWHFFVRVSTKDFFQNLNLILYRIKKLPVQISSVDWFVHNSSLTILVPEQDMFWYSPEKVTAWSHRQIEICSLGPSSSLLGESGSLKTVVVHHQDHLPLDHLLRFLKVVQRRICDKSLDRVIENWDLYKQPAWMGRRTEWFISRGLGKSLFTGADLLLIASSWASLAISSALSSTSPWSSM